MPSTVLEPTEVEPVAGLLDNALVTQGRYIAHVAVPCRDLDGAPTKGPGDI